MVVIILWRLYKDVLNFEVEAEEIFDILTNLYNKTRIKSD